MSEDVPTYFVRDFCAVCGEQLVVQPNGTKIACHPNEAIYWSEAVPLPKDLRGCMQLTAREPEIQTACRAPGGQIVRHAPLFLYRSLAS